MIFTKRQAAIDYATIYGWPVFACLPNSKSPAHPGGFKVATTDPDQINSWWNENEDYNIGFSPTNADITIIDLDTYQKGFVYPFLDSTYVVKSPRGGEHHYFYGTARTTNGTVLGIGIDSRGIGGYVLLPPSTTEHGQYEVLHDRPIASLPKWISERLQRSEPRSASADILDTGTAIDRATEYLRAIEPAIEGHSGNNTTFEVACSLFDLGLSVDKALELSQDWNKKCLPPWSDEELNTIFNNAWRYRHDAVGAAAVGPAADVFRDGVCNVTDPVGEAEHLKPLTIPEIRKRAIKEKDPEYLWKGRLLRYEPNLWTGDAGIGKTTLVENLIVAVASGSGLLGQPTIQAPVLLFVAEDRYKAVLSNLDAIAANRSLNLDELPIKILSTDSEDCEHLFATITDEGLIYETPFFHDVLEASLEANSGALLVLDPLAEFIHFDHNSDKAARACARQFLVPIARRFQITPLVTDHPSRASLASGEHYGGSKEMKAAFASFGTLRLTDPKDRGNEQRQALTFEIMRTRYGPPSKTEFYRLGKDPAYKLDPASGMTPAEIDKAVLNHILQRIENGLTMGKTNTTYGPEQAAEALGISAKLIERSVARLSDNGLLIYNTDPGKRHPPTWAKGPKLEEPQ